MHREMRAALNKFFTPNHYKMRGESPANIWKFLEKYNGFLFFRFDDCGPFKGGPWANISYDFLLQVFSPMIFLKVRVGCQDRLCVNSDGDETLA